MRSNWEYNYYKRQFEVMRAVSKQPSDLYLSEQISKITEQAGQRFTDVLELGAGQGDIANALASLDKKVTTVELVEEISDYAKEHAHPNVQVICDDFYTVKLEKAFDLILYLDGFGVGEDEDQLYLLKRIYNWMSDEGCALIDIYQPLYWQKIAGKEMYPLATKEVKRRYDYDVIGERMTDTWWQGGGETASFTQSLACYSPQQIYELCEEAGLQIVAYFPSGAMDFEKGVYKEITSLEECLSYRIKLKKNSIPPRKSE